MTPFTTPPVDLFMIGIFGCVILGYLSGRQADTAGGLLMLLATMFAACGYFSVYLLGVQGL